MPYSRNGTKTRYLPVIADDDSNDDRPKTRAECVNAERPCPWVSCRYHLYLEVNSIGRIRVMFSGKDVDEIPESCALDVADKGEHSLDGVGALLNLTHERIRQVEVRGLIKIAAEMKRRTE